MTQKQEKAEEIKEVSDKISDIIQQLENTNKKVFAIVGCPEEGISKELNTIRREIQSIIDRLYSICSGWTDEDKERD